MNIAFYTAGSGMLAFQKDLDVVSNNIANVGTTGYKPARSSFRDLMVTEMDNNEAKEQNSMVGHGTQVRDVQLLMAQGPLERTEYDHDFAIVGDGFFAVERNGEREYTRNGAFKIGSVGRKNYLTASDGAYVLDTRGRKIELSVEGGVAQLDDVYDKLGIFTFPNPEGLTPLGGNSYQATEVAGRVTSLKRGREEGTELVQGMLERSNVDLGSEMVRVIQSQRAYSLNAKIVQTADQIEEMANNLR